MTIEQRRRLRQQARDRFRSLGFPTQNDEEWRLTSVAPIAEGNFVPAIDGKGSLSTADLALYRAKGRWGEAKDIAGGCVFLAGGDSDYLNGAVLNIDGGWMGR